VAEVVAAMMQPFGKTSFTRSVLTYCIFETTEKDTQTAMMKD
jgi:hypothetical protein